MAQMRSADRVRKCLMLGVDRTYSGDHETDASDPKRRSPTVVLDHLVSLARIDGGTGGKTANPFCARQAVNDKPAACLPWANDPAPFSLYIRK
jgi:hypothetical protein